MSRFIVRQVCGLLTSSNELAQLGALNMMLKANSLLFETAVLPEVNEQVKNFGG